MGGKKKKGGLWGAFKGAVSDGVKVASAGTVDLQNQKVSFNPESMGENIAGGITGQGAMEGLSGPAPEKMAVEDPAIEAARAKTEAENALMKEIGLKNGSAAPSTSLGGSFMADNSNLKKKKLLGE